MSKGLYKPLYKSFTRTSSGFRKKEEGGGEYEGFLFDVNGNALYDVENNVLDTL